MTRFGYWSTLVVCMAIYDYTNICIVCIMQCILYMNCTVYSLYCILYNSDLFSVYWLVVVNLRGPSVILNNQFIRYSYL